MSTVAERARAAAMPVEGKKNSLSQQQDGHWKISFTVAPDDMPQAIAMAPMGTRYMLAIVQIGDDEEPVPPVQQARAVKPPDAYRQDEAKARYAMAGEAEKAVTRAAILCGDDAFQKFIAKKTRSLQVPHALLSEYEKAAAFRLRHFLGISSRAKIGTEESAFNAFLALEIEYRAATGQFAEERG